MTITINNIDDVEKIEIEMMLTPDSITTASDVDKVCNALLMLYLNLLYSLIKSFLSFLGEDSEKQMEVNG